jgi:hypothetical protein
MRGVVALVILMSTTGAMTGACGGAEPPPPVPPPPSPLPVATEDERPLPPEDPRVVRCGIDDRPRKLGLDSPPRGETRAKPAPPAFEPPPMPTPAASRMMPRQRFQGEAPFEDPAVPMPTPRVEQRAPRFEGGPVDPQAYLARIDQRVDECGSLMTAADRGPVELTIALAGTGDPLTVRSSREGTPSPYVHCLMDRGCALRPGASAGGRTMFLALELDLVAPPPPPPPRSRIDEEAEGLRALVISGVREVAPTCVKALKDPRGAHVPDAVPLIVSLRLERPAFTRPRQPRGGPSTGGFAARTGVVKFGEVVASVPAHQRFARCVQRALATRSLSVGFFSVPEKIQIEVPLRLGLALGAAAVEALTPGPSPRAGEGSRAQCGRPFAMLVLTVCSGRENTRSEAKTCCSAPLSSWGRGAWG